MSVDYCVYIGPFAVCADPRRGCLAGAQQWLIDHDERLYAPANNYGPIEEGQHFFIPNDSAYAHCVTIDPLEDASTWYEMPDATSAVLAFDADFAAELAMLRENFCIVDIECGIIHWAW